MANKKQDRKTGKALSIFECEMVASIIGLLRSLSLDEQDEKSEVEYLGIKYSSPAIGDKTILSTSKLKVYSNGGWFFVFTQGGVKELKALWGELKTLQLK